MLVEAIWLLAQDVRKPSFADGPFRYKPRGRLLHRPLEASGCEEETTQTHLV